MNKNNWKLILQPFHHFTYVTTHSPTLPSLYLRQNSFSNLSVASPTSQFILQPFFRSSYITRSSLNSPGEPPMLIRSLERLSSPCKVSQSATPSWRGILLNLLTLTTLDTSAADFSSGSLVGDSANVCKISLTISTVAFYIGKTDTDFKWVSRLSVSRSRLFLNSNNVNHLELARQWRFT